MRKSLFVIAFIALFLVFNIQVSEATAPDYNQNCVLDEEDAQIFLQAYANQLPSADLAEPFGEFSYFDVSAFMKLRQQGLDDDYIASCQNTAGLQPCEGWEDDHIYPVSNYNGEMICPTPGVTRIIYVNAGGDDNADGLSPATAWRTPQNAVNLASEDNSDEIGSEDWVVFKRGDTWLSAGRMLIRLTRAEGGQGSNKPLVITAYGAGQERPLFNAPGQGGISIWGNSSTAEQGYITLSGLHFKSSPGTGGLGFDLLGSSRDIVFEDNIFDGFAGNRAQDNDKLMSNVLITGNIIVDNASAPGPGGHSQGLFASGVRGLVMRDNVIDRNGWAGDRDHGMDPSLIVKCEDTNEDGQVAPFNYVTGYIDACLEGDTPVFAGTEKATIFNHNLYLQADGYPAVIEGNIFSRASSHGSQLRSGGTVENNIYSRNPLNAFVAGGALDPEFESAIRDNVALEGNDINGSTPRGFGFTHNGAYASDISGNIIANMLPTTSDVNNRAFDILCGTGDYPAPSCSPVVVENIVFNWADATGRAGIVSFNVNNDSDFDITMRRNQFSKPDNTNVNSGNFLRFHGDTIAPALSRYYFKDNVYRSPGVLNGYNGARFDLGSDGTIAFIGDDGWQALYEPTAQAFEDQAGYTDPCRTLVTYYDDVILGNTGNDNCAIMHDDQMYEDFMQYLRVKKSRFNADENINHLNILNYLRAGFDMEAVE